jgi:hypothetical protein
MSEIERRSPKEADLHIEANEKVIFSFSMEELDDAEVELITTAKAYLNEVEELAKKKESNVDERRYKAFSRPTEGGTFTVVGVEYKNKKVDSKRLIRNSSPFSARRIRKALKKASEKAEICEADTSPRLDEIPGYIYIS